MEVAHDERGKGVGRTLDSLKRIAICVRLTVSENEYI